MVRALHQPIFMANTSVEQHAMDELRALVDIKQVLIADLEIDAETQARRVLLDDGSGMIGCPIVLVDRIAVNFLKTMRSWRPVPSGRPILSRSVMSSYASAGSMAGSWLATAWKTSGYFTAMRSEPMPPIEMPVMNVPSRPCTTLKFLRM